MVKRRTSTPKKRRSSSRIKKNPRKVQVMIGNKIKLISVKILREIKKVQMSTENLIPKLPFARLVHEVMQQHGNFRLQSAALQGLQAAVEMFMTQIFEDSYKCTLHRSRITLDAKDVQLVANLGSRYDKILEDYIH